MSFDPVSLSSDFAADAISTPSASAASTPAVAISASDSLFLKVMDSTTEAFNHLISMNTSFSESSKTREEVMQKFKTFALASGKIKLIDQFSWDISVLGSHPRMFMNRENEKQEMQKTLSTLIDWLQCNHLDIPLDLRLSRDRMIRKIFAMICGHEFFAKIPLHHSGGDFKAPRPTSEQLKNTPFIQEIHTVESGDRKGWCIESIWIRASSTSDTADSQSMAVCIEVDGKPPVNNPVDQSSVPSLHSYLYLNQNQPSPVKKQMYDIVFLNPAFDDSRPYLSSAKDYLERLSSSWFISTATFFPFAQQLAGMNLYYNSGFPEILRKYFPSDLIPIILAYSLAIPSLQIDLSGKQSTYRNFFGKKDVVASASDPAQK